MTTGQGLVRGHVIGLLALLLAVFAPSAAHGSVAAMIPSAGEATSATYVYDAPTATYDDAPNLALRTVADDGRSSPAVRPVAEALGPSLTIPAELSAPRGALSHGGLGPRLNAVRDAVGVRAFTNRAVGVESRLFGHSQARGVPGLLNRPGSPIKIGWTSSGQFGGGMHFRIGLGRSPLNANQARWHLDLPWPHVDNATANPIVQGIRNRRGLR